MPTENRSSNTDPRDAFIRLNPLGLGEAELRKDSTGFEDQRTHSDYLLFLAGYRETHPEPQHHTDPGEVERCEARLHEVSSLCASVEQERDALRAQLAECEAMAAMIAEREWAEHAGTGPVSSKVEAAFTQLHNDLHEVGEKLAERDALLDRVVDHAKFWHDHPYAEVVEAIAKDYKALSASAEPSAPKCATCHGQGEVYSGQMADQGYNQPPEPIMDECPECKWIAPVERAERAPLKPDAWRAAISGNWEYFRSYEQALKELREWQADYTQEELEEAKADGLCEPEPVYGRATLERKPS
jgi:hypothetical protein